MPTETHEAPVGLGTSEVARILGVSTDRVRQLARSGRLSFSDTPYGRLFDPGDVETVRQRYATDRTRPRNS